MFKIKDGYKLDLQTTETMRLFRNSRKKLIDKTKNGKSVLGFEVVEVVLVQCNVADDQYKQKSEVLYTVTPHKLMFIVICRAKQFSVLANQKH